jgi:hypothetical protein
MAGGEELRVTTTLLWRATFLLSMVAAALLPLVSKRIPRERFADLKVPVVGATFLVWLAIWSAMVVTYWDSVYVYFFPAWSRWPLPLLMGTGFAATSLILWHLAGLFRRWPAVAFVLLGGALGPVTHTWAVLRGIVTKPPMLQGASPVAAICISAPEFAIYFTIILFLAASARSVRERYSRRSSPRQEGAS